MNTRKKLILFSFVLFFGFAGLAQKIYASSNLIIIVNDLTDDVQVVPWKEGMTFYDALVLCKDQNPSTNRAYIISRGKIRTIPKLSAVGLGETAILAGDVVIFGGLTAGRIVKLKTNGEIDAAFSSLSAGSLP